MTSLLILIIAIVLLLTFLYPSSKKKESNPDILDDIEEEEEEEEEEEFTKKEEPLSQITINNRDKIISSNPKLVVIKNVEEKEIIRLLTEFTEMYNEIDPCITSRIIKNSEIEFIVFFPYDTTTDVLHYLVDYISEVTYGDNLLAWHQIRDEDKWLLEDGVNDEFAMVYNFDEEQFAGVYLTTNKNKSFKLDFSSEVETIIYDTVKIEYKQAPHLFKDLILIENYIEI